MSKSGNFNIFQEVENQVDNWEGASVQKYGITHKPHDVIKRAYHYASSEYLSGKTDSRGRRKPFRNISLFRWNVATRATDFDTKDIQILPEEPEFSTDAMIYTKEIINWMDESNFAEVLNLFGHTRAGIGDAVLKKTFVDGELRLQVLDWGHLIFDPNDVLGGLVIEPHEMTRAELWEMREIFDNVDEAMDLFDTPERARLYTDNQQTTDTITVYEVHGKVEVDGDYKQMKYFLTGIEEESDIILLEEEEKELPYKRLQWRQRVGFPNALGVGILEDGFEAQEWTNDMVLKQRDIIEIISKVGFKTDSDTLDQSMLHLETGFIWKLHEGEDISPVQFNAQAMPQLEGLMEAWDKQYEQVSSTFEAVTGETLPSGTPFRSVAIQNQEASSMFAYRREEAGTFWEEVFTDWILPEIAKKINREHLLSGEYTPRQLEQIDRSLGYARANKRVLEGLRSGEGVIEDFEYQEMVQEVQQMIRELGQKRFINIPKNHFKNFKGKVRVVTTNEQRNKAATLESLDKILSTAASAPQILENPGLRQIFAKAVDLTGAGIYSHELEADIRQQQARIPQQSQTQVEPQVTNEKTQETAAI